MANLAKSKKKAAVATTATKKAPPVMASLGEVVDMELTGIADVVEILKTYYVPMTAAQIDSVEGDLLLVDTDDVDTTAVGINSRGLLACQFLLLGVCVELRVDGRAYSLTGLRSTVPAAGTDVPANDGNTQPQNAVFWCGAPAWLAADALLKSFRLRLVLCDEFEIASIPVGDMGCICDDEWIGFSDSNGPFISDVLKSNDLQNNSGGEFIPQNTNGALTTTGGHAPANTVPYSYGGPEPRGFFGGIYPTPPILMGVNDMPLQLILEHDPNSKFYSEFVRFLSDESTGLKPASLYSDTIVGGAAGSALTYLFKYGIFEIGVKLRGVRLTPRACLEWWVSSGYLLPDNVKSALQTDLARYASLQGFSSLGDLEKQAEAQRGKIVQDKRMLAATQNYLSGLKPEL